jgi:cobalt/nickel transport system permease protein
MGAGHRHALYRHGSTPLHRVPPQCKLLGAVGFVLTVAATPREAVWAFAAHAAVLLLVAHLGGVRPAQLARRLVLETPFVLFALALPLVGRGERVELAGVGLSLDGLWAAWSILVKATLGVGAAVVLATTTALPELLRGLERLRVPAALTTVASFMLRYLDVIADELGRMRVARVSRGHDPRWLWQARAVAATAGTLFIRSFERGERVYLAMVSRGWDGAMPRPHELAATRAQWAAALSVPLAGAAVALSGWAWVAA